MAFRFLEYIQILFSFEQDLYTEQGCLSRKNVGLGKGLWENWKDQVNNIPFLGCDIAPIYEKAPAKTVS